MVTAILGHHFLSINFVILDITIFQQGRTTNKKELGQKSQTLVDQDSIVESKSLRPFKINPRPVLMQFFRRVTVIQDPQLIHQGADLGAGIL